MASKDEYYQRIIASLQSDINQLKATLSEHQKQITHLESSLEGISTGRTSEQTPTPSHPSLSQKLSQDKSLLKFWNKIKKVCDATIQRNIQKLPEWFVTRHDLEKFKKEVSNDYATNRKLDNFSKQIDSRLSALSYSLDSIESNSNRSFSLFTITFCNQKSTNNSTIFNCLKNLKNIEFQGCLPFIALFTICALAAYMLSAIK